MLYDVLVIGGGPAGMMAAIVASQFGAKTALIEKNERLGRKLGLTGKGRCNLTNTAGIQEYVANYANNGKFMHTPLAVFSSEDTIKWFEDRGLQIKVERGGRAFPVSDRSADVVNVLRDALRENDVKLLRPITVENISFSNDGASNYFSVFSKSAKELRGQKIIIATGGMSYTATGSTGDGYRFAKAFGHTVASPRGALSALLMQNDVKILAGVTLKNVSVRLKIDKKESREEFGDLLFTHRGVSGPTVLTLSSAMSMFLASPFQGASVRIDLKPALTVEQLTDRIQREIDDHPGMHSHNLLTLLMPKVLAVFCAELWRLPENRKIKQMNLGEIRQLAEKIKELILPIVGPAPLNEAIVTAGGVNVKELDPKRMESRLVPGLFFAGEVVDIDGLTGGFNLQMCFSTGFVAGKAAAHASLPDDIA